MNVIPLPFKLCVYSQHKPAYRFSLIKYFYKEANTISELRKNHLQIDGNRIPSFYYSVMII